MHPLLQAVIWDIAERVLDGMSREEAIAEAANEHGLLAEDLHTLLQ